MGRAGNKAERLKAKGHVAAAHDLSGRSYEEIELRYKTETPLDHRRQFGQFFTPIPIAELMCDWICAKNPKTILDPAVGPGVFPAILTKKEGDVAVLGLDLDPEVLKFAEAALPPSVKLIQDDFLTWQNDASFDAIIANPPYLRHHDFNYDFDIFASIGSRNHVKLSKLTNIYALFTLEICRRLNPGGRAAIIIPTEWTNANFGVALKHFLLDSGFLRDFLYFTHESLPFEDALTTACVLLIERPTAEPLAGHVTTIYLKQEIDLRELRAAISGQQVEIAGAVVKQLDRNVLAREKKWNHLLQDAVVEPVEGLVTLGALAKTRRGIATGANEFFHLSLEEAKDENLGDKSLSPCIGRAADVVGTLFTRNDFDSLVSSRKRTHLVTIDSPDEAEEAYLAKGAAVGLTQRYLLAARKKWYTMELRPPASIWAAVFGRSGLRFVRNRAGVQNLTTFHCIYPNSADATFSDALAVCLNSRFVQDRSRRQHRVYGGGLLKVEPKDLLDIEVPDLRRVSPSTLSKLAALLEETDESARSGSFDAALEARVDSEVAASVVEAAGKPLP